MKLLSILLLALTFGITSCCHHHHNSYNTTDYVIIGSTGGFAGTSIGLTDYYQITGGHVMKDVSVRTHSIPDDNGGFNFNISCPTKYDSVKDLLISIPTAMLQDSIASYGQSFPDAGYTEVRASINGTYHHWYFQYDQSISPAAIKAYSDKFQLLFQ